MTVARAFVLSISDVAFASPPPTRPSRPAWRPEGNGAVAILLRTVRRELAHAVADSATDWMPRITRYPY
jgi:hypothetical protein